MVIFFAQPQIETDGAIEWLPDQRDGGDPAVPDALEESRRLVRGVLLVSGDAAGSRSM